MRGSEMTTYYVLLRRMMRMKRLLLLKDPNARNSRARHRHVTQVNLIQSEGKRTYSARVSAVKKNTNSRHTTNGNKKMRLHFTIYTPYRTCSFSCMTGGNDDTCAAHPAASCCLKPFNNCWNMWFSSCEGLFHLTIALQNHNKLCGCSVSRFNPLRCTAATYLGDASRVGLYQCA